MIDKVVTTASEALAGMTDGQTVLVSGFGEAGAPTSLLNAAAALGLRGLTVVANNAGSGSTGLAALLAAGSVAKIVCSFPKTRNADVFERLFSAGQIELELVPQGTLSERIRAAGAGVEAFYTPTGVGTQLVRGKETRMFGSREYVLEHALHADWALIHGSRADRWGNLVYSKTARNFAPSMATAAGTTVAEVDHVVALGALDPEHVITPGIFVDRVWAVS